MINKPENFKYQIEKVKLFAVKISIYNNKPNINKYQKEQVNYFDKNIKRI